MLITVASRAAKRGFLEKDQQRRDKNARMLLIAKPGGLENYFTELAERTMNDPTNVAAISEISVRYGITLLGPPISARR